MYHRCASLFRIGQLHEETERTRIKSENIGKVCCIIKNVKQNYQLITFLLLLIRFRYGTFGFITEYGAEKKISKYSSVHASVSVGVPTGVILKIK